MLSIVVTLREQPVISGVPISTRRALFCTRWRTRSTRTESFENVDAVYAAAVRVAEAAHKNGRKPLNEKHDEFKKLKLGLTKS